MNLWKKYYKEEYPKFWKEQAPKYASDEGYIWYYENIAKEITRLKKVGRVLDCGCGTGEPLGSKLFENNYNYFGIDLSKDLAFHCKKKLQKNIVVGDLENLPFKSNCFDFVIAISTSWCIEDFEKLISEMHRLCKKDGFIVFDILNKMHISEYIEHSYNKFVRSKFGKFLRKLKRYVQGRQVQGVENSEAIQVGGVKMRARSEVEPCLTRFKLDFKSEGFYVLLPLTLPFLKDRFNFFYGDGFIAKSGVGRIFRRLRGDFLKSFAAKIIYFCRKK